MSALPAHPQIQLQATTLSRSLGLGNFVCFIKGHRVLNLVSEMEKDAATIPELGISDVAMYSILKFSVNYWATQSAATPVYRQSIGIECPTEQFEQGDQR